MKSAIDSSILLDLLLDDPQFGVNSQKLLLKARSEGALVICEVVLAKISPALSSQDLHLFLRDLSISFVPSTFESALMAGKILSTYLRRTGKAKRVVPDFLIGAHALCCCDRLLARDRGFFEIILKDLKS